MNDKHNKSSSNQDTENLIRNLLQRDLDDVWSERVERLLQELHQDAVDSTSQEQQEFLSVVINDALDGVDISQRYPHFFQVLLHDPQLREAFEDGVELLANSETTAEPAFIAEGQLPATILKFSPSDREQKETESRWFAAWSLTADKLQTIVDSLWGASSLAFRSTGAALEPSHATLLRRVATLDRPIEVLLQASHEPQTSDSLILSLWTGSDDDDEENFPGLVAQLEWGNYRQELELDEWGEVRLAPLPIEEVVTPEGRLRATSLYLKIATVN